MATMLGIAAHAQVGQVKFPPGKLAVLKAGTSDTNWPMITARCAPIFVQAFDPVVSNSTPLVSVAMSTNSSVPGSVWVNHHAGSEGGSISRSTDRQFLALEGYAGNILTPTSLKPSTDQTVTRGIVTLDAFTNATSVYSDLSTWFGIPAGSGQGTQDNPTGIASTDGQNFWGTGNFAPVGANSGELSGTLFYNPAVGPNPFEVQNYIQAAGNARIIGGTLYIAAKPATGVAGGLYNFLSIFDNSVVPLPYDPNVPDPYQTIAKTNLFLPWGSTYALITSFDMNPAATIAYGADQQYGIVKFTNNAGVWSKAYVFSPTNLGTYYPGLPTAQQQTAKNQGCFGMCVDFSGTNPVIYATTMENGYPVVNTAQGHQNQNRLIKIVDGGTNPAVALVAQTLAVAATTNEFFGGIDFTPDLRPFITTNPANYSTITGGSAPFSVAAQSVYALSYQWLQNGTNVDNATNATLTLNSLDTTYNNFTYQCVATNNYGSVTSTPAILTVTTTAVAPTITSGTSTLVGYINGNVAFPAVTVTGTQPFTSYQWYVGGNALSDAVNVSGSGYSGSQTPALTVTNLQLTDSTNYYLVVVNAAGYASNKVDVLTVKYQKATITSQPVSATTFVGLTTSLTAIGAGATPPVTNQWYKGTTQLSDIGDYTGSSTPTLTISPAALGDSATNYYLVISNGGGSVTSLVASVTVLTPPAHSAVSYSNQVYVQTFDSLPDPGGVSVNSINNPLDSGTINGAAYSLANPFDFAYPVITSGYVGGLGLVTNMAGWYGSADTLFTGVDGITRFGAQDGDQTTGGVIDFGPNDVNAGIQGTNRALGLLTTGTTGPTSFALKLTNNSPNTLNYINLSYLGELWHNGTGHRTMSFGYTVDSTANSFVLNSSSISNATLVPALNVSFPTAIVVTTVDGTQPSNQVNLAVSNLPLSTPWTPGAALWLIWSMDYYGSGAGNGYAIDNLNFSATVAPVTAPTLGGVTYTGGASGAGLRFTFANTPGASSQFTVWSTTNLTLPFAQWSNLGHPSEVTAGNYQFTDAQATNKPARFYQVTSP